MQVVQDDKLAVQPQYSDFLKSATDDPSGPLLQGRQLLGSGSLRSLPLRVQHAGFAADATTGLVAVPVSAAADQMRAYVEVSLS